MMMLIIIEHHIISSFIPDKEPPKQKERITQKLIIPKIIGILAIHLSLPYVMNKTVLNT